MVGQPVANKQLSQSQYASSFNPPILNNSSSKQNDNVVSSSDLPLNNASEQLARPNVSSNQSEVEEENDIAWTDGYEKLKAKHLDDEEQSNSDKDNWHLPEDYSDLSAEVLSSLPAHIRKSIVEEARRKERARARSNYIPVAENPALYSQTQLANFLQTRYSVAYRICVLFKVD
jgi:hypothetical protein